MGRKRSERLANDTKLICWEGYYGVLLSNRVTTVLKKMQLCISKEPGEGMLNISTMKEQ